MDRPKRYNDFNFWLRERFGCRVQKVTIDAGFNCPNRDGTISDKGCIYCNARGSGTGAFARGESVSRQLKEGIEYLGRRYKAKKFIAYFQAFTNTYGPVDKLAKLYREALLVPNVVGLAIGTRPDCIDEEKLDLLSELAEDNIIWVEYGLQSAKDQTLVRINRGHSYADFASAVNATAGRGIYICTHLILGLPGESPEDMENTAKKVAGLPIDAVKLHLLYVVRGTSLAEMYDRGQYEPLSMDDYVAYVCRVLRHLPENIVIQRLTGDPHPHELVAPKWSLEKQRVLRRIEEELERGNIFQGDMAVNFFDDKSRV
jgi:radical SAM protein (TIGR01212 family)